MTAKTIMIVATLLAGSVNLLWAQNGTPHAGYFDVSGFDKYFKVEPVVELDLSSFMLNFASGLAALKDKELADVLDNLEYVRVRKYPLADELVPKLQAKMAEIAKTLEKRGWQRIARVREGKEDVKIYVMPANEKELAGAVVMVLEPGDDAVFANLYGRINPAQIGRVGQKWDLRALDSLRASLKF